MEGIKHLDINDYFPHINVDELASDEEMYFLWWLVDLYKAGYIHTVLHEPAPFELGDGMEHKWEEEMKTKTKYHTENVLQPNEYTTDFVVYWTPKAYGIFVVNLDDKRKIMSGKKRTIDIGYERDRYHMAYCEIKGDFDNNNMTRLATINIKWVWHRYKVYVNLHKVPTLFKKTFTPERYIYNNKNGKKRTIKFNVRSLEQFVISIQK